MSFEEVKEVFVDTLNCDADKVTMDASLTDDRPFPSWSKIGRAHV